MKMKRIYILLLLVAVTVNAMAAAPIEPVATDSASVAIRKAPMFKHHRIDREIDKNPFALKGECLVGLTASYGTITTEDTNIALFLDDLKLKGSIVQVKPFFGYFYNNNHCVGVRLGYTYMDGSLGNVALNLGESSDISLSVGGIHYAENRYTVGLFHRTYVALGAKGNFAVFADMWLSGSIGDSVFEYKTGEGWKTGVSKSYKAQFTFNPGLAVYIFPNVCGTVSFGLGGLQYTHIEQFDGDSSFTGKRDYSNMRFRFNIAEINIGVTVHLWNRKNDAKYGLK